MSTTSVPSDVKKALDLKDKKDHFTKRPIRLCYTLEHIYQVKYFIVLRYFTSFTLNLLPPLLRTGPFLSSLASFGSSCEKLTTLTFSIQSELQKPYNVLNNTSNDIATLIIYYLTVYLNLTVLCLTALFSGLAPDLSANLTRPSKIDVRNQLATSPSFPSWRPAFPFSVNSSTWRPPLPPRSQPERNVDGVRRQPPDNLHN